jgi:hypothetical protein
MDFTTKILEVYPELEGQNFLFNGIVIQDDADGKGAWLRQWGYSKPLPAGLKLGK